jgi:hypothetical protein
MQIELSGFDPLRQPIRVRVSELIKAMGEPGSGTCTGGYAHEPACANVFATTALDPAAGVCAGEFCRGQRIFASR